MIRKSIVTPQGLTLSYLDSETPSDTLLLCIHGLGTGNWSFRKNIDAIPNTRCIAPDLPGYGRSQPTPPEPGDIFLQFVGALHSLVDAIPHQRCFLICHSMGSRLGDLYAHQYPKTVKGIIRIAPAGFELFSQQEIMFLRANNSMHTLMASPPQQIAANFAMNVYHWDPEIQPYLNERLALLQNIPKYLEYARLIERCVDRLLDQDIPHAGLPSCVIFGDSDRLIPNSILHSQLTTKDLYEGALGQLPGSSGLFLEHCGHMPQWEKADRVNAFINNWLQKNV